MAISRFLRRIAPRRAYAPLPSPADPVAIIGDVHGCADLMDRMLDRLAREDGADRMRVVFVGDLIDRGPDSATVLRRVHRLATHSAPFAAVHCVLGNHEQMMLDFLDKPEGRGTRWLAAGGDATLLDFGVQGIHARNDAGTAAHPVWRDGLAAALGDDLTGWLRNLPRYWQDERLIVCHAGANPRKPMEEQTERELIWGPPGSALRRDGLWIAHGHVILPAPECRDGRIAVDTGAWIGGPLTAALVSDEGLRFVQVARADAVDAEPSNWFLAP